MVEIIQKNDASEYIHFMGFQRLDDVYKKYQLYISTSIFETFGLVLLETASSGCDLISLNVPYGNTTLIENEKMVIWLNITLIVILIMKMNW